MTVELNASYIHYNYVKEVRYIQSHVLSVEDNRDITLTLTP